MPVFTTPRLIVRELTSADFQNLKQLFSNRAIIYTYETDFNDDSIREWLGMQIKNYRKLGFGIWAVTLKSSGEFIGQAGLTLQINDGKKSLEISYLLKHEYWHLGYAEEITQGCKIFAFQMLKAPSITSVVKREDIAAQKVMKILGMQYAGVVHGKAASNKTNLDAAVNGSAQQNSQQKATHFIFKADNHSFYS